ncbi:MAG: DUF4395 domain-containing protein, partial [Candidatus Margulisiibacteriota bacterium]
SAVSENRNRPDVSGQVPKHIIRGRKFMLTYDMNGIRFCQGTITLLLLAAYFSGQMPLVVFIIIVMLGGAAFGVEKMGLFYLIYVNSLRSILKFTPVERERDPLELRFAQGLGAAFLILGVLFYYLGLQTLAWAIVLLVMVLSFLATLGFCLGSIIYAVVKNLLWKRV